MSDLSNTDTLIYQYHDASVPPSDHRSFIIRLTPLLAELTIDSYGEIIANHKIEVTRELLINLVKLIKEGDIYLQETKQGSDGSGGTGESLILMANGRVLFSGEVWHCIEGDKGALMGELDKLSSPLKRLFKTIADL